jgi:hypothetical protein
MNSVVLFRHSHSGTFRLAAWAAQFRNNIEAKRVYAHVCSLACKHKVEKFLGGAMHCHHVIHLLPPALDPCDESWTNLQTVEYNITMMSYHRRETESWCTEN